jgi:hypothetical protein
MASEEFVYKSDLEKTPLAEILATVNRYGVPGVLEVEHDGIVKHVYLLDGDIIFATSTDRDESLGDYLVRAGEITAEQLQQSSEELASSPGARHGEILVKMGFLDREKLGAAVRKQVQAILWSLFNWSEGQVTFKVGRAKDDEIFKIKIPTARAIIAGCRRIEDPKVITARLGGRGAVFKRLPRPQHLEDRPGVEAGMTEVPFERGAEPGGIALQEWPVEPIDRLQPRRVIRGQVGVGTNHQVDGVSRHQADQAVDDERHDQ